MRRVLVAVAVLFVGLVVAALALVSGVDGELVGRELLRRANEIDGVTIATRDIRLALFSGLELTEATASVEFESNRLELELDRLTLEHDLWSLLLGRVVISKVVLEKPHLELRPAASAAAHDRPADRRSAGRGDRSPPRPSEPARDELAIAITSWRIEDGSLRIFGAESADADLEIDGLTLDLHDLSFDRAAGLSGMSAAGSFRAAEIRSAGSTVGQAAAGEVLLEGGRLRLEGRLHKPALGD